MNDFQGLLTGDYGFKQQGKSAPMAPPRSNPNTSNPVFDFDLANLIVFLPFSQHKKVLLARISISLYLKCLSIDNSEGEINQLHILAVCTIATQINLLDSSKNLVSNNEPNTILQTLTFKLADIRAEIPKHCWVNKPWRSMSYVVRDFSVVFGLATAAAAAYVNNWIVLPLY